MDSSVKKVIVVMTDGLSYDEVMGPAMALQNQQNTIVIAIGIGSGTNFPQLQQIATDPDDRYLFEAADYDALNNLMLIIGQRTCE